MKPALLTALCIFLSSCALSAAPEPRIYRIGEIEIRLYKDQGRLAQELPPVLSAVQALGAGTNRMQVLGYFDRQNKRIYSLDDTRVLLHELRHYLEPDWNHDIGCGHLTASDDHAGSLCDNKPTAAAAAGQPPEPAPERHARIDSAGF